MDLGIIGSYAIVAVTQFALFYLRTKDIIYTVERNIPKAMLIGLMSGLAWCIGIFFGLKEALINGNYFILLAYIIPSLLGKYLSLKHSKKK